MRIRKPFLRISKASLRVGIDARLWSQSGVGRYIRNLVLGIDEKKSGNTYCVFLNKQDFNKISFKSKNVKKILCDIPWHSIAEQYKFPKVLERESLDLVHFPYFSIPIFYKKPYVITIHDLIIDHFPTGKASSLPYPLYLIKKLGYKKVVSNSVKNAKWVITPSNATKEEIITHFKIMPGKINVIYEAGFTDANINNKVKLDINNYFLYVGNAYPHKNIERLIEAFNLFIKENDASVKLVLAGREDFFYKKVKKDIKNKEISKNIIFFGEANDNELKTLYKNAKALVIPSLMEGFGLTALEALSLGCLVLASGIPSISEVCRDSAIYFNPEDIYDIKEKLKMVYNLEEKEKEKLIALGLKRSKIFSWDKMVDETIKVYESCIDI